MKYNVGDRVKVKSLQWFNENINNNYTVVFADGWHFSKPMSIFCGKELIIEKISHATNPPHYRMKDNMFGWTDEMIEGLVEEGNSMSDIDKLKRLYTSTEDLDEEIKRFLESEESTTYENAGSYKVAVKDPVKIARHFAQWQKNQMMKDAEEETKPKDIGEVSDGYHTFDELYEYRMLYNAALFNEFAKQGLYDVHKSRKHSDGEYPFGDSNWFIVMAELPTGQISNHYEMKDWDKFQIPEKPLANKWDEHSPRDVADRLTSFTNPKKEYPKTYEECCRVLGFNSDSFLSIRNLYQDDGDEETTNYEEDLLDKFNCLWELITCRDAYWKIAGEEMGLGKSWEPDWTDDTTHKFNIYALKDKIYCGVSVIKNHPFAFPTEEMRDVFYENFKEEIKNYKEFL